MPFAKPRRLLWTGDPRDIVQDTIEQRQGRAKILSQNFLIGLAQGNYDQATAVSGGKAGAKSGTLFNRRQSRGHSSTGGHADVLFRRRRVGGIADACWRGGRRRGHSSVGE